MIVGGRQRTLLVPGRGGGGALCVFRAHVLTRLRSLKMGWYVCEFLFVLQEDYVRGPSTANHLHPLLGSSRNYLEKNSKSSRWPHASGLWRFAMSGQPRGDRRD